MKKYMRAHPRRTIVLGFMFVILIGALLLMLPIATVDEVNLSFTDGLFTSTSAVCVTGLIVVDTGDTFTIFGRFVIGMLIQIGGLGITSIGVITILLAKGNVSMGGRRLAKEALNLNTTKSVISLMKAVFYVTIFFEIIGAVLSTLVFLQNYNLVDSIGLGLFHSVASFNNAGFDLFGDFKSLADYQDNVPLNIITSLLIIFGGLGFFVIKEIFEKNLLRDSLCIQKLLYQ